MKSAKICLIFLSLVLTISANAQTSMRGFVTDIIDGKTLVVTNTNNKQVTIQLKFIEVPEANQPLNDVVKQHLHKLAFNQKVDYFIVGLTPSTIAVGKVSINGVDLSQQMIRDGAAWYNLPEDGAYAQTDRKFYKETESLAKIEQRGVWSVSGLKPSWENRAEIEAKRLEQERLANEAKAAQDAKDAEENAKKSSRQTEEFRRKANESVRVWANVYNNGSLKDYETSYDSQKNITSLKSQSVELISSDLKGNDSLSLGLTHNFSGREPKAATNDFYIFDVTLKSETIDLSATKKGNKLVFSVGSNKYTLEFLGSKNLTAKDSKNPTKEVKSQMFSFKMSKKDFDKFIKSTEVDFEMDIFKGTIAGIDLEVLKKVP